ncbi:phosphoribosyltransferase family protein [Rodentibacter caecimuris]|uniref:Amidophosphoribosyltransferase n=1 Tax=Rodentibacter caecimuris TaxID=1796644 RepID=A0ABX3KVC2_9PAST|nr:amidophosphoribosyltransferase [Rodentibacter heylii]
MNLWAFSCFHCHQQLRFEHHGLCSRCRKLIRHFSYCGCCGAELQQNANGCGRCLKNEPAWDKIVIVGSYIEPLSILIHYFKFQKYFWLDRTLSQLLLIAVWQARRTHFLVLPQVILPVPLYHFRQWLRGYNQSSLLAKGLATYLRIPYRDDVVLRGKHTHTQRGLSAKERRNNLKNAFHINPNLKNFAYQSVAIVDDVITTGTTLSEVAKQLRKLGVTHIQVWGVAKA